MMMLKAVSIGPSGPARVRFAASTHCLTFLSEPISGTALQSLFAKWTVLSGTSFSGLVALAAPTATAVQTAAPTMVVRSRAFGVNFALTDANIAGAGRSRNTRKLKARDAEAASGQSSRCRWFRVLRHLPEEYTRPKVAANNIGADQ